MVQYQTNIIFIISLQINTSFSVTGQISQVEHAASLFPCFISILNEQAVCSTTSTEKLATLTVLLRFMLSSAFPTVNLIPQGPHQERP